MNAPYARHFTVKNAQNLQSVSCNEPTAMASTSRATNRATAVATTETVTTGCRDKPKRLTMGYVISVCEARIQLSRTDVMAPKPSR